MVPVIAIIGQPNVGKSTLFNRLTQSQQALVLEMPGVTRDRIYGQGKVGDKPYIVIDTGGIIVDSDQGIDKAMYPQIRAALDEAVIVLFMVDARCGVTSSDLHIADMLRPLSHKVHVVVNKIVPTEVLKSALAAVPEPKYWRT